MAVKVTGLFQSPQSNLIHESPILGLVPHLEYPGVLNLEVRIISTGSISPNGGISFPNVNKNSLIYPTGSDPYTALIDSLETYVIQNLENYGSINPQATFSKYTPPTGSNFM